MLLNSRFPKAIGLCASDRSGVAAAVNECQEILIADPMAPEEGWYGSYVHVLFQVQQANGQAYIVTPREIARIDRLDICTRPRFLRGAAYEYLMFGNGKQPKPCQTSCATTQGFERDNLPLLYPFPSSGPQGIRFFPSNNADLGKLMQLQGTDQNGKTVYGTDPVTGAAIIGEQVSLALPFSTAAFSYQQITGLMKDETNGPVLVYAVDSQGNQTLISQMAPNETVANYRQYFLNGLPCNCSNLTCNTPSVTPIQVDAMCKLDYIPVENDSDYLTIQSIPALIEEGQARRWSTIDAAQASKKETDRHANALRILCGQLDHYFGKTTTAIGFKIFGRNRLRPQPV